MTQMLKKALQEASQVPEEVQDKIAALVMAELQSRPAAEDRMQELVRRGLTDKIVRNRPEAYQRLEPLLSHTTVQELLDQDRNDR
ncbi:MAG: hypothetical protein GY856_14610 [bacterium]|nr:hypothetical protein [bacterium]